MSMSEEHLFAWQSRLAERLGGMIERPGEYAWDEMIHAVMEGRTLYHALRGLESEVRQPLERAYFPQRLAQLETRMMDARSGGRGAESLYQEETAHHLTAMSDQLEQWASEVGTTVEDLVLRGAEAIAEGRVKKRPGPPKGRRRTSSSEGPWTPQMLKAELARLGVTYERLGAAMTPPCGRPSVFKWIQGGIPQVRQDQITRAMESFEREHSNR